MHNKDLNILIVDDHPGNLLVLESLLEPLDITITKASSGNEALGYMFEQEFFLVLMDVQMPEMNGFEVAELMRGSQRTKQIPIIFITAISKEQQYVFKGYELGAVDYLFKPIEPVVLKSKVTVFMEMHKQTYKLKKQTLLLEEKIEELIALRESNNKLEKLSFHDGLTGIDNRRSFDQFLETEWLRAQREKNNLSLVLMDIDFFKQYNDHYGHIEGDETLKKVAQALKQTIKRPGDFVGRYGGEEFVIVLPNTDKEGAVKIAEEVRYAVEALHIMHESSKINEYITISVGCATWIPDHEHTVSDFINQTDEALYTAKRQGRNRVICS